MAKVILNWRYGALMAVFGVSLVLMAADSDDMAALLLSKVAGVGGFALFGWLVRRWARSGKVNDLMRLASEE